MKIELISPNLNIVEFNPIYWELCQYIGLNIGNYLFIFLQMPQLLHRHHKETHSTLNYVSFVIIIFLDRCREKMKTELISPNLNIVKFSPIYWELCKEDPKFPFDVQKDGFYYTIDIIDCGQKILREIFCEKQLRN